MGGYPDLNRERIVPHTIVLPIELYPPNANLFTVFLALQRYIYTIYIYIYIQFKSYYLGMIRTFNNKYQKFMTYLLVYKIYLYKKKFFFY